MFFLKKPSLVSIYVHILFLKVRLSLSLYARVKMQPELALVKSLCSGDRISLCII